MSSLRVLIADDHPVVRAGLRAMLGEAGGFEVVAEAPDGAAAISLVASLAPDVVLMDLRMPVMDGAEATARLVSGAAGVPAPAVLILTTFDTDADIVRAVEAGAQGFLLKDAAPEVVVGAIRAAARGETVLAPNVEERLAHPRAPGPVALTSREQEVLACVARGLSNAAVGRELFIGEATVKTHLVKVFQKLGVDDRTAAVTRAYQLGLLDPTDPDTDAGRT